MSHRKLKKGLQVRSEDARSFVFMYSSLVPHLLYFATIRFSSRPLGYFASCTRHGRALVVRLYSARNGFVITSVKKFLYGGS